MTPLKTFIVEDSPVLRVNLIATLEELAPVEVVGTAECQAGAMSWLRKNSSACDLMIIDIFLKNGSGLGILKSAQGLAESVDLVVLSNYATPEIRRQCLACGARRVFDKSTEIDELLSYCDWLAGAARGSGASWRH